MIAAPTLPIIDTKIMEAEVSQCATNGRIMRTFVHGLWQMGMTRLLQEENAQLIASTLTAIIVQKTAGGSVWKYKR